MNMSEETFELKTIHEDSVPTALERAHTYRMLNDPIQAESICLDILAVDSDNQKALRELVLAMSEQFEGAGASHNRKKILEQVAKFDNEYDRAYFAGLVCEREAIAFLGRGQAAMFAYDGLRDAMEWYEKAAELRKEGNDDPLLRWNSCVRTIKRERLKPLPKSEGELPLD